MADSHKNYTFQGDVGSVESHGHVVSSGNHNTINSAAGEVKGDYKSLHNAQNYTSEQAQILTELKKAETQIQKLLTQLQAQGHSPELAQREAANYLATKAKQTPEFKDRLKTWGHYLGDAAANNLIGTGTIEVIKLGLNLIGFPMP
ncbi:MAG: hypothetical protein RIB93_19730 [Coleofasciculus sp. D1-CHI-01]|uniref:hypothetical protein n=1 Tax=Coleofasciculus sp. D1-CHI-01 TaxID=3068482 RepID=UPI0033018750